MTSKKRLLALALVLWTFAATAQNVPKPKEFYFDEDRGINGPIVLVKGEGEALIAELLKERERGRKQLEATAQLAHVAIADNRADLGKSLYQQAINSAQPGSAIWRSISWNYGWDLYRLGEYPQALQQWTGLVPPVGAPSWLPPTLALGLWSVDRKNEAVEWYAAAVRTEPARWNNPANFPALLPDWREEDRAKLAEVHAAWLANPPRWP